MAANKKKGGVNIIMIIVGLLIFGGGGLALTIAYNPGNINENVFKNIPVLNSFLPPEKAKEEEQTLEEKYYDYSKPRLKEAVFTLEKEKTLLNEQIKKLTEQNAEKNKEITRLKEYENTYTSLKKEKETFSNIVANQDKKAFSAYYEKVSPEVAKQIYTEITKAQVVDEQTKKYISTLDTMKVPLVASMMDDMIKTDFDQVLKILQSMDQERTVKILESMDPKNTTKITKKLTGGIK
ncbi:MAG TPA: hypothetical protein DEP72_03165 [Clostridiales bacterium]|nr:MAG: hypothetical protein A2Y18_04495 [Clostridiales bacterium GWD2_32_19]HCC07152.1 hypothetical protein [Clostridiales bacterium]